MSTCPTRTIVNVVIVDRGRCRGESDQDDPSGRLVRAFQSAVPGHCAGRGCKGDFNSSIYVPVINFVTVIWKWKRGERSKEKLACLCCGQSHPLSGSPVHRLIMNLD